MRWPLARGSLAVSTWFVGSTTTVVVGADGQVRCAICGSGMEPMEYRSIAPNESTRPWLFWACVTNSDHVTPMLPLPAP